MSEPKQVKQIRVWEEVTVYRSVDIIVPQELDETNPQLIKQYVESSSPEQFETGIYDYDWETEEHYAWDFECAKVIKEGIEEDFGGENAESI